MCRRCDRDVGKTGPSFRQRPAPSARYSACRRKKGSSRFLLRSLAAASLGLRWKSRITNTLEEAFGLVPGFLIFSFGNGVGDDAAAYGKLQPAFACRDGPDQDIGVHVTVEADVAQAAAVGSAGGRF